MLFLAVIKQEPKYVAGRVFIGLVEARSKYDAEERVLNNVDFHDTNGNFAGDMEICNIGEFVQIAEIPSKYKD